MFSTQIAKNYLQIIYEYRDHQKDKASTLLELHHLIPKELYSFTEFKKAFRSYFSIFNKHNEYTRLGIIQSTLEQLRDE